MAFQSSRRPARYQVCATQAKSNYCLFIWREWFFNCFYGSKQWVIWLLHLGSSQSPLLGRGNISTLFVNITGQFSLILSIVDRYNTFCSKETNCVCVFSARIWEYPPLRRAGQASLWPNSNDPPWSGWWRGGVRWCGAARAPLINTSAHVLQIQLCHFQFSNCPRGPAAATPPPSQPSTASTTKLKQKGF